MTHAKYARESLKQQLEFLNRGGYRVALGWRAPWIFEDSPICPKTPSSGCPSVHCVLMEFVPAEHRGQTVPCRHIALNPAGETLQSLYSTGTMEKIETAVRGWLEQQIGELEKAAEPQVFALDRRAPVSIVLKRRA
jgi:hypothetical protein